MSANGYLQLGIYLVVLIALAKPLGAYMARIYQGEPAMLNRAGAPLERVLYRISGVDPAKEMHWTEYAIAMLVFNFLGFLAVYALRGDRSSPSDAYYLGNLPTECRPPAAKRSAEQVTPDLVRRTATETRKRGGGGWPHFQG